MWQSVPERHGLLLRQAGERILHDPKRKQFAMRVIAACVQIAPERRSYMKAEEARKRAADLVSRMTLEEKASQLRYDAPAIERLHGGRV